MAATLCIVITGTNETITNLNDKLQLANIGRHDLCNLIIDYIAKCAITGVSPATLQVTSRDTDPGVTTSGAGSLQTTKSM